ncbi:MAG: cofactor-independent phosphoglycerate mutase, partial [Actinobacteria bacterium]|nr:cofactor-independent phosphoglycerate mutase [Actinomycetota bacterium]
ALMMLAENDLVIIHVESPDTAGHDGEAEQKVAAIEAIDREIVARLMDYASGNDLRILALPDHPTPLSLKTHSSEAVPFVLWGPGIEANGGERLCEKEAALSGVVIDPGHLLMGVLLA